MNKEFIQYLKSIKKRKKLTNEKLSSLSNVPLGTINKLFSGDTENPKMSTISAVCKALDVSIEDMEGNLDPSGFNVRMTLKGEEAELIQNWRKLDTYGKVLTTKVVTHEITRIANSQKSDFPAEYSNSGTGIITPPEFRNQVRKKTRKATFSVPLYELPVSAGSGMFLEDTLSYEIDVPKNLSHESVDFALKIRGDSMEPDYKNGEIILIKNVPSVQKGDLGIFNVDGEAFFKIYSGDRLLSLNKKYPDIRLSTKNSVQCLGKVVGKLEG